MHLRFLGGHSLISNNPGQDLTIIRKIRHVSASVWGCCFKMIRLVVVLKCQRVFFFFYASCVPQRSVQMFPKQFLNNLSIVRWNGKSDILGLEDLGLNSDSAIYYLGNSGQHTQLFWISFLLCKMCTYLFYRVVMLIKWDNECEKFFRLWSHIYSYLSLLPSSKI